MQKWILITAAFLLAACGTQQKPPSNEDLMVDRLLKLLDYMSGTFNSAGQASRDTNYFDITLNMTPVWSGEHTGHWLYVEQAVSQAKDRPYRQRVYRLGATDSSHFLSTVYALPQPERFIGALPSDSIWSVIHPDSLLLLKGCTIFLEYQEEKFYGSTKAADCTNSWGEAAYATSEVTILPDTLLSWDRGWDSTDTQVWGAESGGYIFVKE